MLDKWQFKSNCVVNMPHFRYFSRKKFPLKNKLEMLYFFLSQYFKIFMSISLLPKNTWIRWIVLNGPEISLILLLFDGDCCWQICVVWHCCCCSFSADPLLNRRPRNVRSRTLEPARSRVFPAALFEADETGIFDDV